MSKWIVEVDLPAEPIAAYIGGAVQEIVLQPLQVSQVDVYTSGPMGPKGDRGDPGDPSLLTLDIDPVLLFENALI